MSSAAFPDIKLNYQSVSPLLSSSINDYLNLFTRLHQLLLELVEKVANIHNSAATELVSVAEVFNKRVVEITKGKEQSPCESIVKFLSKFIEQVDVQGKCLQNLKASFCDCVVKPLQEAVDKKKEVWKTCFHYADSFVEQIKKKEDDLQKRHKAYSDAASKVKPGNRKGKQLQIFYDSHNTYLLRLSSVNSINSLLYTHVLPHMLHSIESNHCELNDQVRHQAKYMFSTQKDAMKKLIRSVDKVDHATDKIDIVSDLRRYIKSVNKGLKDKSPPLFKFVLPRVDSNNANILDNIDGRFVINKQTKPNLQRRLCSLQQQTEQLFDSIATMRSEEEESIVHSADPALNELIEFLCICDKEANLNVLLKQDELYTPRVKDFLGPMMDNLLSEQRHTSKSPEEAVTKEPFKDGERPHQFIEPRVMKPISCFYCSKLSLIGKGYICKICKISVHKKCATYVQFCQPAENSSSSSATVPGGRSDEVKFEPIPTMECLGVYDLIDLESDEDYYDEDEFDDGLSDDSEYDASSQDNKTSHWKNGNTAPLQETKKDTIYSNTSAMVQSEKPAVLRKPNLLGGAQLVKVLPDLLTNDNVAGGAHPMSLKPIASSSSPRAKVRKSNSVSAGTNSLHKKLPNQVSLDVHRNSWCISDKPATTEKPVINSCKPAVGSKPGVQSNKPNIKSDKPNIKSDKPVISKKPVIKNHAHKKEKPPILKSKPVLSNVPIQQMFCVSLYDYRGNDETDLSFVSGCKVEITHKTDNDWWYGTSNGYEGYFPAQYVLEINEKDCIMRALYSFNKESEKELNIEESDILVLVRYEEDWAMVRSKDGEGLVPAAYVEQVGNQTIC